MSEGLVCQQCGYFNTSGMILCGEGLCERCEHPLEDPAKHQLSKTGVPAQITKEKCGTCGALFVPPDPALTPAGTKRICKGCVTIHQMKHEPADPTPLPKAANG